MGQSDKGFSIEAKILGNQRGENERRDICKSADSRKIISKMMKVWEKLKQQIGQQSQISSETKLRKITSDLRQNLSLPTLSRDTQVIKDSFSGMAYRLLFSTNMDALFMSMGETSSLNIHKIKAIRGQVESENYWLGTVGHW